MMTNTQLYTKFGLWIGGSIVFILALWWFIIHPTSTGLANDVAQILSTEQRFNASDITTKQFITASRNITKYNAAMQQVQAAYVPSTTPFNFIGDIEDIANQYNVTLSLDVSDYVPNPAADGVTTVPINITISGELTPVLNFIQAILREPIELTPQDLKIEANTTDSVSNSVKANFQVTSYWL